MILGLIPARGGSKGIPRKNIRPLGGKPLIAWTIEAAREAGIRTIVVSTEDHEIAEVAEGLGVEVLNRPAELATDTTPMVDVIGHAVVAYELEFSVVVLLQPTSPFRDVSRVKSALRLLDSGACDSVISVREIPTKYAPIMALRHCPERGARWAVKSRGPRPTRRQDIPVSFYRDGELYAFRAKPWRAFPLIGRVVLQYPLNDDPPINLDTEADWQEAERRLLVTA